MRLVPLLAGLLFLASTATTLRAQTVYGAAPASDKARHASLCLVDCQASPAHDPAASAWGTRTGMFHPGGIPSRAGPSTLLRLQISNLPSPPPGPPQVGTRYRCGSPVGYYPNVAVCRTAWKTEPSWPFK